MEEPRDKIIVVDGGPDVLVAHPEFLSCGNIFHITPLPSTEDVENLTSACSCRECGEKAIRLLAYETSGKVGGFVGRCKECNSLFTGFFSEERPWSADLIIAHGSSKSIAYRDDIERMRCPLCNSSMQIRFQKSADEYDVLTVLPMMVSCTQPGCECKINVIFWDTPKSYFHVAMNLADEVTPCSPRVGLVFLVSAFETYLQKAFMFQSPRNKFLIERRKVNFQSLKEARDVYRQFMDVDIKDFTNNQGWEILTNAIKDRHGLIHNAGLNRRFEEIVVTNERVGALKQVVVDFIDQLNPELERKSML